MALAVPKSTADKDTASFKWEPRLDKHTAGGYSFSSLDPKHLGEYVQLNGQLSGTCAKEYAAPSSDLVLGALIQRSV